MIDLILGILFMYADGMEVITVVTVFLVLFMLLFGLTIGPVIWLYVPEILPAHLVPFASIDNWIGTTIVYCMTPIIVGAFDGNPSVLFFIFAGSTLICLFINALFMIETKNLSRE